MQLPTPCWVKNWIQQFLTKNDMTPVPHPPYSPNISPKWHFLFSKMNKVLKGKPFANWKEVKQKTAKAVKGIKINTLKNCFEQWKKYLDRCIASNGEYFEGYMKFKHVRINMQFFINKFHFLGPPPHKILRALSLCQSGTNWLWTFPNWSNC